MDYKNFRNKVEQELKKMDKRQIVEFAWRFAIRAIPLLGARGNFSFWKNQERQKYIYSIFNAVDITAASTTNIIVSAYNYGTNDAAAAANEAFIAARAANAGNAGNAAAAAANAVASAYAAYAPYAAYDAASAANVASAAAKVYNIKNFESDILNDIYCINVVDRKVNPIDVYGEVWNSFLEALEKENCAYWGRVYKDVFESGFQINKDALERRLNVPKEIREQGAAAVANYLEELEKGAKRLNEARIIILGEKGAGKTCLARRLVEPDAPMTKMNESTKGVDTTLWELEKHEMNVRIWDFAGHVVTHAVHQFFLSERCLYIIVYDGRTEGRNRLEYWLDHMKNYGGDSKAIILVNRRDANRPDIAANNLKEKYPIARYFEFSIKDDKADLEVFRDYVASYIKENTSWNKQEIPTSYYNVKEELEKLFSTCNSGKGLEHIPKEKFIEIANKHKVKDNEKLLKDLHFLGVSLWYKEMQAYNTMVLNPEWISDAVYTIINWVHNANRYSIKLEELSEIFKGEAERYPEDKHRFLFNLIRHYELAYETKQGNELIIPHLLDEDRPKELPLFHVGESLMLRYKAEQPLPPNTISRFIVRHNKQIKKESSKYLVWRYGVVLSDDKGSTALIREEDRTISVSVKGTTKTNYISALRGTLNTIFDSYKSEKPELEYRVERFGLIPEEMEEKDPLWLSQRRIVGHIRNNVPYFDVALGQHMPLDRTVNIYNIEKVGDYSIIGGRGHNVVNNITTFKDCNIGIQGNLNELSDLLVQEGYKEEAKELQEASKALEKAEQSNSKEEIKKKGLVNKVRRFLESLEDENSKFHKSVKGVKNGISIAQDIAKGYNDIAQWAGLPQVPRPFLKRE